MLTNCFRRNIAGQKAGPASCFGGGEQNRDGFRDGQFVFHNDLAYGPFGYKHTSTFKKIGIRRALSLSMKQKAKSKNHKSSSLVIYFRKKKETNRKNKTDKKNE